MHFSAQEMAALFPNRVIAIRGTIDNMCFAEAAISTKLQECYEQDQGQGLVSFLNCRRSCIAMFHHIYTKIQRILNHKLG